MKRAKEQTGPEELLVDVGTEVVGVLLEVRLLLLKRAKLWIKSELLEVTTA